MMSLQIIGHIQQLLKEKDLTTCSKVKAKEDSKELKMCGLKTKWKARDKLTMEIKKWTCFLSCFYRCLLHHFSQDLLNHVLSGLFNLLLWLPYTCRNGMRYCDHKCYFCPLWVVLILSITLCRKPCKHVGQNLRPCSTSRCFWRALNGLATVCRAMHKMDQDRINLKVIRGMLPKSQVPLSDSSTLHLYPDISNKKYLGHPWPPLNLSTSMVGKHSFVCTQRWCQQR